MSFVQFSGYDPDRIEHARSCFLLFCQWHSRAAKWEGGRPLADYEAERPAFGCCGSAGQLSECGEALLQTAQAAVEHGSGWSLLGLLCCFVFRPQYFVPGLTPLKRILFIYNKY